MTQKEASKRYREKHKDDPDFVERRKNQHKKDYELHKETINAKTLSYYEDHKEEINKARNEKYRLEHPKKIKPTLTEEEMQAKIDKRKQQKHKAGLRYAEKHKEENEAKKLANLLLKPRVTEEECEQHRKEIRDRSYQKHIEENRERCRKYYENNYDKIYARKKDYKSDNLKVKIANNLRCRVYLVLKGRNKSAHTMELVGCSIERLMGYLEAKFQEGMTWDNYGEWEIDHIRPCASFDLLSEDEQKACFHYTNLQPLWMVDNRSKSAKW